MGTPAGSAFHFTVTQYIQEGVFLLAPVPQNFHFFERPGRVPSFKNECLLPTIYAALEAAILSEISLEATKNLEPVPGGGPASRPGHSSHRY